MAEPNIEELTQAVERQHGGTATPLQSVHVKEAFRGQTVWEGDVQVFQVSDHPKANRAYAWSAPIKGTGKHRIYAMLRVPPIDSPQAAVRATIAADHRGGK